MDVDEAAASVAGREFMEQDHAKTTRRWLYQPVTQSDL
jgi:hypothetical protein